MTHDEQVDLLRRWRQGDQQAAAELFRCYTGRLIALSHSRLSGKLAARFDPEDVVQSAYRSFFSHVREGRFDLECDIDLWNFLAVITLRKLRNQVRRNRARKRTLEREQSLDEGDDPNGPLAGALALEPSPVEAVALVDELERVMKGLDPVQRRMLELRLQGYSMPEIAVEVRRSEITVRRFLKDVKRQFERWDRELDGE